MLGIIRIALYYLLNAASLILLARCILSWIPVGNNRLTEFLYTVTEPFLAPIRNLLSKTMGGQAMYVDFSPIVAFLLISLLQRLIL